MTTRNSSDLPFGSEFSPSQVNLPDLLGIIEQHQGDPRALEAEILQQYFTEHAENADITASDNNRRKLANNSKLGLIAYQIIDRQANFTDFGKSLYYKRENETELYEVLAKHILLHLNGMTLIQCIQDMTAAGEEVNLTSLLVVI